MAASSPPIDIGLPNQRFSSSSPRNQSSNLTTALQQAGSGSQSNDAMDIPRPQRDENRPNLARQESAGFGFGSSQSGARPITVNGKPRKESTAGSYMGGMSWGGLSVGSFIQDDIMTGTSPYNTQSGTSFHSSSYLPKKEAMFFHNMDCCGTVFDNLHTLLAHNEEVHNGWGPSQKSQVSNGRRKSSFMQGDSMRPLSHIRGFQAMGEAGFGGSNSLRPNQLGDGARKPSMTALNSMETIGDMELDDEQPAGRQNQSFAGNSIDTGLANNYNHAGLSTPKAPPNTAIHSNNPLVSSVNTPSMTPRTAQFAPNEFSNQSGDQHATPTSVSNQNMGSFGATAGADANGNMFALNNDFNNLDFNSINMGGANGGLNNDAGSGMLDLCINNPARALFSNQGNVDTQQYPQFGNFVNGAATGTPLDGENHQGQVTPSQQLAANRMKLGLPPDGEDRPFKCPVIGCEKAYKNANGLRYHEKHGHNNQQLKENPDGSFSIVDPATSEPYPGTVGMEKEKPYRCEVCGKRYKNLNGLKYHRNHSPPCNPDFHFNNVSLPGMGPQGGGMDGIDNIGVGNFGAAIGTGGDDGY